MFVFVLYLQIPVARALPRARATAYAGNAYVPATVRRKQRHIATAAAETALFLPISSCSRLSILWSSLLGSSFIKWDGKHTEIEVQTTENF